MGTEVRCEEITSLQTFILSKYIKRITPASKHINARRHFFNLFFDVIFDDLHSVALYYNLENLFTSYI